MNIEKTRSLFLILFFSGLAVLVVLLMQPLQIHLFIDYIAMLFPKGLIALEERNLLFLIQALMLLVIVPVYVCTFLFSWYYRADNAKATYDPDLVDHYGLEVVWWGVPLLLIAIISVITWVKTYELDPYKPIDSDKPPLKVEVIALQWKWLFLYPEEKVASVNVLHLPVGRPIHFEITSDAPMNSFWIPRLGGQIYAMPGMKTELYLIANEPGEFRGSSANISGEGFSGMHFMVKAIGEEDFRNWADSTKKSLKTFDQKAYQQLLIPSSNLPEAEYALTSEEIFSNSLMKYMSPPKEK